MRAAHFGALLFSRQRLHQNKAEFFIAFTKDTRPSRCRGADLPGRANGRAARSCSIGATSSPTSAGVAKRPLARALSRQLPVVSAYPGEQPGDAAVLLRRLHRSSRSHRHHRPVDRAEYDKLDRIEDRMWWFAAMHANLLTLARPFAETPSARNWRARRRLRTMACSPSWRLTGRRRRHRPEADQQAWASVPRPKARGRSAAAWSTPWPSPRRACRRSSAPMCCAIAMSTSGGLGEFHARAERNSGSQPAGLQLDAVAA